MPVSAPLPFPTAFPVVAGSLSAKSRSAWARLPHEELWPLPRPNRKCWLRRTDLAQGLGGKIPPPGLPRGFSEALLRAHRGGGESTRQHTAVLEIRPQVGGGYEVHPMCRNKPFERTGRCTYCSPSSQPSPKKISQHFSIWHSWLGMSRAGCCDGWQCVTH